MASVHSPQLWGLCSHLTTPGTLSAPQNLGTLPKPHNTGDTVRTSQLWDTASTAHHPRTAAEPGAGARQAAAVNVQSWGPGRRPAPEQCGACQFGTARNAGPATRQR